MNTYRLATVILSLSLLVLLYFGESVIAQDSFHSFTDKQGRKTEAQLVSIAPDMKKMRIKKKGGDEFEVEIVTLSLDDQQYLKDWVKKNPVKSDFNLEVNFSKHLEGTKRYRVPNYDQKWVTDNTRFKIEIKNLSTDAKLTGASLEYYIVTEHGVYVSPTPGAAYGDEWWYPNNPDDGSRGPKVRRKLPRNQSPRNPLSLKHAKAKIEDLAYNFAVNIETDTIPLREIIGGGNKSFSKDAILGVIVRITDNKGNEISVHRSSENKFLKRSWDEISRMPPGDPSGMPRQPQQ